MIGILADHRINNDPITGQAFVDDPPRQRRTLDPLFLTRLAGAFLAFDHPHKMFGRLNMRTSEVS